MNAHHLGACVVGLLSLGVATPVLAQSPRADSAWRAVPPENSARQARLGPPVTGAAQKQVQTRTSQRDSVVEQVFGQIERENQAARQDRRAPASRASENKNLVVRAQAAQAGGEGIYLAPPPVPGEPQGELVEAPPQAIERASHSEAATAATAHAGITRVSLPVVMTPTVAGHHPQAHSGHHAAVYANGSGAAPHECAKTALPPYVIEAPDILMLQLRQPLPDKPLPAQVLVRPDGTISLGLYGSVAVAGLTIDQARSAIEAQLARSVKNPEVAVDVYAYNSKFFYVITDGGGYGEQVIRIPITGNETVLDAVSQINGLPAVASKKHIWLARSNCWTGQAPEILPVDWNAIVQRGMPQSNYQLMSGDRLYVKSDKLVRFDSAVAKVVSPFERMFGFTLLGNTTVQNLRVGKRAGTSGN